MKRIIMKYQWILDELRSVPIIKEYKSRKEIYVVLLVFFPVEQSIKECVNQKSVAPLINSQ